MDDSAWMRTPQFFRWSWTESRWKTITAAQYSELLVCAGLFRKIRLLKLD